MGGYLGVQQGSRFPPQFVHLIYRAENPGPDTVKVALVGKGLTFDRLTFCTVCIFHQVLPFWSNDLLEIVFAHHF